MNRTLGALICVALISFCFGAVAEAKDGGWKTRPFVDPVVGYSMYGDSSGQVYSAVGLGAQAGIRYHQKSKKEPILLGTARLRGEYLIGQATGLDIRLGNFIGPWYKFIGLQTGPDVFWNQYEYGSVVLDPTMGLAWPVRVALDLKVLFPYAGVSPAWYFSDREAVDWGNEDAFGFGQEFTRMAGVTLDAKVAELSVSYQSRVTAYGHQNSIGAGIKIGL